ncbi:MAG TPA: hypothetical protein PKY25_00020 [Bacilli bacterium]|nr:hypothetical protein [Bacilli bacterium]
MEEEAKRYCLKLKLKKGNNIEYITLLQETLVEIDKLTTISYTKEKLIMLLPKDYVSYLCENYNEIDLVVTYGKEKEYPVLLKKDIDKAYITDSEIEKRINFYVINDFSEDWLLDKFKGKHKEYIYSKKLSDIYLANGIGRRYIIDFLKVEGAFSQNLSLYRPKGINKSPLIENIEPIALNIKKILDSIGHEIGKMNQFTLDSFKFIKTPESVSESPLTYNARPVLLEMLNNPDFTVESEELKKLREEVLEINRKIEEQKQLPYNQYRTSSLENLALEKRRKSMAIQDLEIEARKDVISQKYLRYILPQTK